MNIEASEADVQRAIIDLARLLGWLVHHDEPSLVKRGKEYRHLTHVTGHVGFPDLVLSKGGVTLYVECKSRVGRLEPEQRLWLATLGGVVVRPATLDAFLGRLQAIDRTFGVRSVVLPAVDKSTSAA